MVTKNVVDYSANHISNITVTEKPEFLVLSVLNAGFNLISLLPVLLILLLVSFANMNSIISYFLLLIAGAGLGLLVNHVMSKLHSSPGQLALMGVFAPTPAVILIIVVFTIAQKLAAVISGLEGQLANVGVGEILQIISPNHLDPIFAAVVFYAFFNVFLVNSIMKKGKYRAMLWYFIAVVLVLATSFITEVFTASVLTSLV